MKVLFTQNKARESPKGWIFIRIETDEICTVIHTSSVFDPYPELYVWLGKIRDSHLPAKMVINEEGRGVELTAESTETDLLCFRIEPWMSYEDQTRLKIFIKPSNLVLAFTNSIIEFIDLHYQRSRWSSSDNLSNINWHNLLTPGNTAYDRWEQRLALYGGGEDRNAQEAQKHRQKYLTATQKILRQFIADLSTSLLLAVYGRPIDAYKLSSFYENLITDLAVNEIDLDWYQERQSKIHQEIGELDFSRHRHPTHVYQERQTRLKTLKVGQIVDGKVHKIKTDGVFVDIGGCFALLLNSAISHDPIDDPKQVFRRHDWVRAIITWMDIEKGRVLLSTADLESQPGDMLIDPLAVYKTAEETVRNRLE